MAYARTGLGSKRTGDGSAETEARIGLGSRRIGDGIAQMDARIGAAAFFIDPGEFLKERASDPPSSSTVADKSKTNRRTKGG
jgi:hypothetical protein